jgi:hypothetical protein
MFSWTRVRLVLTPFLIILFIVDSAKSHIIPFAFFKGPPIPALNYDFTTMTSLPSDMTLTRTGNATYIDSSGVVQTAAANTARFNYDIVTHAANGLLLEPAATNLLAGSADFNFAGSYWNAGGSTMTTTNNTIVAPDGTTSAERFTGTMGLSYSIPSVNPTTTNGQTYTFSIFAKSTGSGWAEIALQEDGGPYTIYATTVMNVTTSWQRFSVTATRASANPMRPVISTELGAGGVATLDVWGAQLELGTIATSYIPTTTTTATRNTEVCTFNNFNWFNGTVGSMYAEYVNNDVKSAGAYRVWGVFKTNVSGTFAQDSIDISDNNTTVTSNVTNASTAQFSPGGSVNAAGTINRQALAFYTNNFKISVNRGAVTTDTSGSLPIGNYMYVGSQPGTLIRSRYIRKLIYYPSVLTNAELQGL